MVLYSPVFGSKTRVFWIFGLNVRFVARREWLRLFPVDVCLPVLEHLRAMSREIVRGEVREVKLFGVFLRANVQSSSVRCLLYDLFPFVFYIASVVLCFQYFFFGTLASSYFLLSKLKDSLGFRRLFPFFLLLYFGDEELVGREPVGALLPMLLHSYHRTRGYVREFHTHTCFVYLLSSRARATGECFRNIVCANTQLLCKLFKFAGQFHGEFHLPQCTFCAASLLWRASLPPGA